MTRPPRPSPLYSFVASSLVKEIAKWGGEVSSFVPELVERRLLEKFRDAGTD